MVSAITLKNGLVRVRAEYPMVPFLATGFPAVAGVVG